jgi:hypothetical protein
MTALPVIPCPYCRTPTRLHCPDGLCGWRRCPACNAYGDPRRRRWIPPTVREQDEPQ